MGWLNNCMNGPTTSVGLLHFSLQMEKNEGVRNIAQWLVYLLTHPAYPGSNTTIPYFSGKIVDVVNNAALILASGNLVQQKGEKLIGRIGILVINFQDKASQ